MGLKQSPHNVGWGLLNCTETYLLFASRHAEVPGSAGQTPSQKYLLFRKIHSPAAICAADMDTALIVAGVG